MLLSMSALGARAEHICEALPVMKPDRKREHVFFRCSKSHIQSPVPNGRVDVPICLWSAGVGNR
jgi:hypothetical protein